MASDIDETLSGTPVRLRKPQGEGLTPEREHGHAELWRLSTLKARLEKTLKQFGDTCIYMERSAWGGLALGRFAEAERDEHNCELDRVRQQLQDYAVLESRVQAAQELMAKWSKHLSSRPYAEELAAALKGKW